jgi:hypothetical protein
MESNTYLVPVYVTYATLSVALTVWLARTLFRNGAVFLRAVFDAELADAVNRLLVVGFYLLNLGYACLLLKAHNYSDTPIQAIEILAEKMGMLLLSLGVVHFFNLYLFQRMRRRAQLTTLPPPVSPQLHIGAAA